MKVKCPELEPLEFSAPDNIKNKIKNSSCITDYYVVDFLYVDVGNSEPSVVQPTKVKDLEHMKEMIFHWFDNKDVMKKLANGNEIKLFPMVEA